MFLCYILLHYYISILQLFTVNCNTVYGFLTYLNNFVINKCESYGNRLTKNSNFVILNVYISIKIRWFK